MPQKPMTKTQLVAAIAENASIDKASANRALEALTEIVGKSTCGNGATGRSPYASVPASTIATAIRQLATGRRTNGRERFIDLGSDIRPD